MTTKHSEQQEKQMKHSLSPAEKKLVQALAWRIKETFSPYGKYAQQRSPTDSEREAVWAAYEDYRKERRRIGKTIDPATAVPPRAGPRRVGRGTDRAPPAARRRAEP